MAQVLLTHTLLPRYSYSSEETLIYYKEWISSQNDSFQKKAIRIFENSAIKERHTIASADVLFSKRSFEETNAFYKKTAIELGTQVLKEALDKAVIDAKDIDCIITTSCTGFMIPSFDIYVINALGLRRNIRQMPITELGCAAGVAALIFANDYLRAYPNNKVAIITLEFPSNTIQLNDFTFDNIVGTAVFADGVACALLGNDSISRGPHIIDAEMCSVADTTDILGYNITNTGLRMNLDKSIPGVIERHFEAIVAPFMKKNNTSIDAIDHYLVHPGGVKILEAVEQILNAYGKSVPESRYIMETYGNMSSSTILFILDQCMKKNMANETALMLGFGPGFSAHQVLLEW